MKKNTIQTVKIKGTDYKVKNTLRAMFIYEEIQKKPFKIETLLDNYVFYYAVLLANNPDKVIDWDFFIDALDEDPGIFEHMTAILSGKEKLDELLSSPAKEGEGSKKKVKGK